MAKALATLAADVGFNRLNEAKSYEDNPDNPKKFTIKLIFKGDDAKKMRDLLVELGKPARIKDGELAVNFSRGEHLGPPKLFNADGTEMVERPKFLPKGTKAKVMFTPYEFPAGVALRLEGVLVTEMGEMQGITGAKPIELSADVDIDQAFLDAFM